MNTTQIMFKILFASVLVLLGCAPPLFAQRVGPDESRVRKSKAESKEVKKEAENTNETIQKQQQGYRLPSTHPGPHFLLPSFSAPLLDEAKGSYSDYLDKFKDTEFSNTHTKLGPSYFYRAFFIVSQSQFPKNDPEKSAENAMNLALQVSLLNADRSIKSYVDVLVRDYGVKREDAKNLDSLASKQLEMLKKP
jgi:hypothetical protein